MAPMATSSISISVLPSSSVMTTLLVMIMLFMHSISDSIATVVEESKDQTSSCTMCDECPNPCPVPSSPPPVVEPPPPPMPTPPVVECPPPPMPPPPVVECPPPPMPPPPPAAIECPPPPAPVSPCDICSESPPGSGVPALIPNRPPRQPDIPYNPNPGNSIYPPNVNPVYYYNPPKPYFSKSTDLRMHYSITIITSIFVFFTTAVCLF